MSVSSAVAVLDAIVAYLTEELDGVAVRRGWPEHPEDLDLSAGSVVTVIPVSRDDERCTPTSIGETVDGAEVLTVYRVAWSTQEVQIDLWSPHRAVRDRDAALIEEAFAGELPWSTDTEIACADGAGGYHARPITLTLGQPRMEDSPDGVNQGEWRCTWVLTARTDLVASATHPAQLDIDVSVEADDVTEPTFTIS